MGRVVSFEDHAVARLRDRLGAVETARADLLAFARGHSEAVATIHCAILHALDSDSLEAMLDRVARDWPALLGVDSAVVAVVIAGEGFRVDRHGITRLDAAIVDRAAGRPGALTHSVDLGHVLFGRDAKNVRSEALVAIHPKEPDHPRGLLLLGHRSPVDPGSTYGAELLEFLGHFLAAMMRRWLMPPPMMKPTPHAP